MRGFATIGPRVGARVIGEAPGACGVSGARGSPGLVGSPEVGRSGPWRSVERWQGLSLQALQYTVRVGAAGKRGADGTVVTRLGEIAEAGVTVGVSPQGAGTFFRE